MAEARPKARPDLDVVNVDGEAVVYDARANQVHYLNHSAALVFGLCDGGATGREIASAIAEVYEMPEAEVDKHVRELIKGLRSQDLLEPLRPGPPSPQAADDARELVRLVVPESS